MILLKQDKFLKILVLIFCVIIFILGTEFLYYSKFLKRSDLFKNERSNDFRNLLNSTSTTDILLEICTTDLINKKEISVTTIDDGCKRKFFYLQLEGNERILDFTQKESFNKYLPRDIMYLQDRISMNKGYSIQVSKDDIYKSDPARGKLLILLLKEDYKKTNEN